MTSTPHPENEYIGYACDCERLAEMANTKELREQLLEMAMEWRAIAKCEEKRAEDRPLLETVGYLT
jgi:hypothetical protein